MEGSFYAQVRKEVMEEVDKRVSGEVSGLYKVINDLKARYTGALIVTGLIASLIGGGVGYVLNNRLSKQFEEEIRYLNDEISSVYFESTTQNDPFLPEKMMNSTIVDDNSVITDPTKGVDGKVMNKFYGRKLIQLPVQEE